jgi:hypothetical protein
MKRTNIIPVLFCFLSLLSACGGTHGKIEWFPFKMTQDSIETIINKSAGNDSIYFIPNDRTIYKDVFIKRSNHFKVFTYRFYGDSAIYWNDDKNQSCIALIYVKDGNTFKNEADLNHSEKGIAIKEFTDHFIFLIKQQITKPQN